MAKAIRIAMVLVLLVSGCGLDVSARHDDRGTSPPTDPRARQDVPESGGGGGGGGGSM